MISEIKNILKKIDETPNFENYVEFRLSKSVKIDNYELKTIINLINNRENTIGLYNKRTLLFDIIGVIDTDGKRYIDFDDDLYTMTNKGIDNQISNYLN
jgi:hypothetical protein